MQLLEKIQQSIEDATQSQLEDALQSINKTEAQVNSNPALIPTLKAKVAGMQRGLARSSAPIVKTAEPTIAASATQPEPITAPKGEAVMGDRDWSAVTQSDIESLGYDDLLAYEGWCIKQNEMAKVRRRIAALRSESLDLEAQSVEDRQAGFEVEMEFKRASASLRVQELNAPKLLEKTTEVAERIAGNQMDRQLESLEALEETAKKTLTAGELSVLRAKQQQSVLNNKAQGILNQTPMALAGAPTQQMTTINL